MGLLEKELPETTGHYGTEAVVVECKGYAVRVPAYPRECEYVRVVKLVRGKEYECAYWTSDEWGEDPADVMGAIMGAICSVARGAGADCIVPNRKK